MIKINEKIIIFFLIFFSLYCSLIVGETWDEGFHLALGKVTLNYLFSFGSINKDFPYREFYSPIYWSLQYLLINIIPSKYSVESSHIINMIFSLSVIFGIGKLASILFNKQVGKITFLILFFYPVFFGHMSFNSKDTILALSHVWITYLILKYLIKQKSSNRKIFSQ